MSSTNKRKNNFLYWFINTVLRDYKWGHVFWNMFNVPNVYDPDHALTWNSSTSLKLFFVKNILVIFFNFFKKLHLRKCLFFHKHCCCKTFSRDLIQINIDTFFWKKKVSKKLFTSCKTNIGPQDFTIYTANLTSVLLKVQI